MREFQLRVPLDSDWAALLDLANRSVAEVPGAGSQEAWVQNRRLFAREAGVQRHWIADDVSTGELLGYVGVEAPSGERGARLFVVTEPALRDDVGARLLSHALDVARRERAADAWFVEYGADEAFVAFLRGHGFTESRRLMLEGGVEACVMAKHLGG